MNAENVTVTITTAKSVSRFATVFAWTAKREDIVYTDPLSSNRFSGSSFAASSLLPTTRGPHLYPNSHTLSLEKVPRIISSPKALSSHFPVPAGSKQPTKMPRNMAMHQRAPRTIRLRPHRCDHLFGGFSRMTMSYSPPPETRTEAPYKRTQNFVAVQMPLGDFRSSKE